MVTFHSLSYDIFLHIFCPFYFFIFFTTWRKLDQVGQFDCTTSIAKKKKNLLDGVFAIVSYENEHKINRRMMRRRVLLFIIFYFVILLFYFLVWKKVNFWIVQTYITQNHINLCYRFQISGLMFIYISGVSISDTYNEKIC